MHRRVVEPERVRERAVATAEGEAEERRAGYPRKAVRAAGEVVPVQQDDADDLAEAERDDGEIVAAQTKHRKAEQDAREGREDAGDRQGEIGRASCRERVWQYV